MSPCHGCHAGCCRSFAVPVTGADILRIERELNLPFEKFACRWADPESRIARRYAPQFFFEDEPATPFVICLQHQTSAFHPGSTKCRFLMESPLTGEHPLGEARCGIYASRPMACRAFPTKFNATGELAVIHDIPASGREGNLPIYSLCPRPWRAQDVDPLQAPQDLAVAKFEMEFFHSIARVWNRAPRAFEVFPQFLRLVYQSRVRPEPAASPQDIAEAAPPVMLPLAKIARRAA